MPPAGWGVDEVSPGPSGGTTDLDPVFQPRETELWFPTSDLCGNRHAPGQWERGFVGTRGCGAGRAHSMLSVQSGLQACQSPVISFWLSASPLWAVGPAAGRATWTAWWLLWLRPVRSSCPEKLPPLVLGTAPGLQHRNPALPDSVWLQVCPGWF